MTLSLSKREYAPSVVRIPHMSILLVIAVLAILLFLMASIILDSSANGETFDVVIATFALNGALGVVLLCKSVAERPFSLSQMHWAFYITMFVIAPYSQYVYGYSVWDYALSSNDYLMTNLALTAWGAFFALFSGGRAGNASYNQKSFYAALPKISESAVARAVVCSILATALVVALVGFGNLFSRDTFSAGLDKTVGLIFDKALRPLPVFAFVLLLARSKQQGKKTPAFYMALVLMLLACFPTGMARYNMACIYGAVLLLASPTLFEKKGVFPVLFLFAFLIVFPASNCYRRETFTFVMFGESLMDALLNLPRGFCAVDYDAYSMVARTLQYVASFGATAGYQLLGALLFFVPRTIWPSKPEGSGNFVGAAQGQTVLNISSPLPAEGVVNFGVAGLVVFAAVTAIACRNVDRWFVNSDSPLRLFYPFACLLLFFIMRGDLLSSFAYTVGYAVSFVATCLVCLGPKAVFAGARKAGGGYSSWLALPVSVARCLRGLALDWLSQLCFGLRISCMGLQGAWSK